MDKNNKNKTAQNKPFYNIIKRLSDIILSLTSLVITLPLSIVIAILIKLGSKGPVLYVSERVGKDGKIFNFYKFRSMVSDADELYSELLKNNETGGPTFKMKNDPRVTKIGRFLRRTSLDEIPQLFNILIGDMTIVGPRPPIPREVEVYSERAKGRLEVKGGLTCYWQISGRSKIDFDGMVDLDLKYIEERGILTDTKILFRTIPAVLKGDGAY